MRKLLIAGLVTASLTVAGAANAGGWATAGVAPPKSVDAGDTWNAQITVLQHGRTPLAGVKPTLTIRKAGSGETQTFAAAPTDRTGVYAANVVFPSTGSWSYAVDDGFGGKHTFGAVTIGDSGGGFSFGMWVLPAALVLVAAAAAVVFARQRRARAALAAH